MDVKKTWSARLSEYVGKKYNLLQIVEIRKTVNKTRLALAVCDCAAKEVWGEDAYLNFP